MKSLAAYCCSSAHAAASLTSRSNGLTTRKPTKVASVMPQSSRSCVPLVPDARHRPAAQPRPGRSVQAALRHLRVERVRAVVHATRPRSRRGEERRAPFAGRRRPTGCGRSPALSAAAIAAAPSAHGLVVPAGAGRRAPTPSPSAGGTAGPCVAESQRAYEAAAWCRDRAAPACRPCRSPKASSRSTAACGRVMASSPRPAARRRSCTFACGSARKHVVLGPAHLDAAG